MAFQLVVYKDGDNQFEVMAETGETLPWRKAGCKGSVNHLLALDTIFTDQSRALKASDDELQKAFGTSETMECAKIILEKGDIQYTAAERKKLGITE
eukprot:CAMPEP_0114611722 /NCGR_PEP_ID=MMETSP0168-20121206/4262_1 /TAXON_ID=95228 ORGANISM="Vannella sp., Strain DIVA3 517/6/12" /NCGR_SAMPLE_ID=MMETSP0168 /ASSEMBLY_ACC=CAM_ASM_000044 /LENGTH=96 /DNA_ID=CAMNT_0001822703 /DNA_START=120 /DNA_END=410 /DNA_ORIENTATION=+